MLIFYKRRINHFYKCLSKEDSARVLREEDHKKDHPLKEVPSQLTSPSGDP